MTEILRETETHKLIALWAKLSPLGRRTTLTFMGGLLNQDQHMFAKREKRENARTSTANETLLEINNINKVGK